MTRMAPKVRVAIGQIEVAWLDVSANLGTMDRVVAAASAKALDLVVFPETASQGYVRTSRGQAETLDSSRTAEDRPSTTRRIPSPSPSPPSATWRG